MNKATNFSRKKLIKPTFSKKLPIQYRLAIPLQKWIPKHDLNCFTIHIIITYSNTYNIYIIYNDFFKYLLLINPIVVQTSTDSTEHL